MKTELICVGTELLSGKLNTNACFVGEQLSSIGLDLSFVTTVGDSPADMRVAVATALGRSQIIILTGGLGPTFDDLTREAVAAALGRPLVVNAHALASIKEFFSKRAVAMPNINEVQAQVIEGAVLLPNPAGTAPGQMIDYQKAKIFLLPGPPREMQAMFDASVFPLLKKYETRIKKTFTLHIFGMGESLVDEKIRSVIEAERAMEADTVSFTILAHQMVVDIRASVTHRDEMIVDEIMRTLKHEFYEILGDAIYGENDDSLESVVGSLLGKHHATLSLAESCTGGLVAHRITNVAGSSLYFKQGVIAYANDAKQTLLGVNAATIEKFGAVSAETAREMALGARKIAASDYAISLTGIAGPTGGTQEKPAGLVYIGIVGPAFEKVAAHRFIGNRLEIRERAANMALDMLRRELMHAAPRAGAKRSTHG
ncbi:MAG: competence/damage-inducible protein A [Elusimicrobia bacterium]|nr:competence/damage-inducible protein A [Elusimicrobiota bacterium]